MTVEERAAAAELRAEKTRTPGDRPSQRRCERDTQSRAWTSGLASRVEVRGVGEDDGPLVFDGFAAVTGRGYSMWDVFGEYTEFVHPGAFAETLAQPDLDVPLVLDHVSSRRLARTGNGTSPLLLSEVTDGEMTGLHVLAPSLDREDPDVAYITPKLKSRLIDEMSFRFFITSGRWSDDYMEYHIHGVDIHRGDVSIVGFGANPHTAGAGLRGKALDFLRHASDDDIRAELERRGMDPDMPDMPDMPKPKKPKKPKNPDMPDMPEKQAVSAELRALLAASMADDDRYGRL